MRVSGSDFWYAVVFGEGCVALVVAFYRKSIKLVLCSNTCSMKVGNKDQDEDWEKEKTSDVEFELQTECLHAPGVVRGRYIQAVPRFRLIVNMRGGRKHTLFKTCFRLNREGVYCVVLFAGFV